MRIAVIGRGNVGSTLGRRLAEAGHEVVYGVQSPGQPDERTSAEAVAWADLVLVAVPGSAVGDGLVDGWDVDGTTVVDVTNPIAPTFDGLAPVSEGSNAELLASLLPGAQVVKAFNTFGVEVMADPSLSTGPATTFVAADDAEAKAAVMGLASELGFDPVDAGPLAQSRWLEALAWLWISMALKYGHGREFAFVLARRG